MKYRRKARPGKEAPAKPPRQKRKWGQIALYSLMLLLGVLAFTSGRAGGGTKGPRTEGPHIKVAGAILILVASYGLGHAWHARNDRKK